jgi:hypothetical protein
MFWPGIFRNDRYFVIDMQSSIQPEVVNFVNFRLPLDTTDTAIAPDLDKREVRTTRDLQCAKPQHVLTYHSVFQLLKLFIIKNVQQEVSLCGACSSRLNRLELL